jgi:hypothetical protein
MKNQVIVGPRFAGHRANHNEIRSFVGGADVFEGGISAEAAEAAWGRRGLSVHGTKPKNEKSNGYADLHNNVPAIDAHTSASTLFNKSGLFLNHTEAAPVDCCGLLILGQLFGLNSLLDFFVAGSDVER